MYHQLATKLSVVNGADAYSEAVPMGGDNAVQLDATLFANTATSLTIVIQGGSDQQNWSDLTTNAGLGLGYSAPAKTTGVGHGFIRLKYTVVGTGVIVLAAGVNTSLQ